MSLALAEGCEQSSVGTVAKKSEKKETWCRPMAPPEFTRHKNEIMKLLRKKGDAAPVCNVKPGILGEQDALLSVRTFLDQSENADCSLVRGFRMFVFIDTNERFSYAARSDVAVRLPNGSIVSFTANKRGAKDAPFIFVPSSRMHVELSDESLLSGFYHLSTVVGGAKQVVNAISMVQKQLSLFERRLFCTNPDHSMAVPSAHVRYYPFFAEFLASNQGEPVRQLKSLTDACVAFGMAYKPIAFESGMRMPSSKHDTTSDDNDDNINNWILPADDVDWIVEENVWLPSVPTLHRALMAIAVENALPLEIGKQLIFELFSRLTDEYIARTVRVHTRFECEQEIRSRSTFC